MKQMQTLFSYLISRRMPAMLLLCFFLPLYSSVAAAEEWIYTVRPGDDLWSLSKKYLISIRLWEKVQKINRITDPIHMTPGTKLRFPLELLKSGASVARITHINGRVSMSSGDSGDILPVKKGMLLWEKDTIRTGPDSSVNLEFSDGSIIQLQSNSSLLLEVLRSYGDTGITDTRIKLLRGRTRNRVIPRSGSGHRFEITTPSATAAVRGTEYRIGVSENQSSRVEVLKGRVDLGSRGKNRKLPGGFGSVAYRDKPPLAPVKLLPAPPLDGLPSTLTQLPPTLTLPPLGKARGYRVQLARERSFTTLIHDGITSSTALTLPTLADGTYYLRVRAIDHHGIEGMESLRSFTLNARPFPPKALQPAPAAVSTSYRPVLKWSGQPEAEAYLIELADNGDFHDPLVHIRTTATSYTPVQPLKPGRYYWRTAAIESGRPGPFSTGLWFRCPPSAPDLALGTLVEDNTLFSWRPGEKNEHYRVQVAADPDFTDIIRDEKTIAPRYSLEKIGYGEFYIRVAAISSDNLEGPFSLPRKLLLTAPFNPWVPSLVALAALLIMI